MQSRVTLCFATPLTGSTCSSCRHKLLQLAGMLLLVFTVLEPSASLLQSLHPHRRMSWPQSLCIWPRAVAKSTPCKLFLPCSMANTFWSHLVCPGSPL